MSAEVLRLDEVSLSQKAVHIRYRLGRRTFANSIWYSDVDFDALQAAFGPALLRALAFHIAAFEINKAVSLRPASLDWGEFQDLVTPRFVELWRSIFRNVWAQWRFENNDPDYAGPTFEMSGFTRAAPFVRHETTNRTLSFCGGGKDSLVATHLLSACGAPFDSLAYAASFYGQMAPQHLLIDRLLDRTRVQKRHKQWVTDDFLDVPVTALEPHLGVRTVNAAETPSSIFAALPIVLAGGYRYICLAHERSADSGQAVWPKTGEDVNHQWGKSAEAERLINRYIQDELIGDFSYFSILKPIYDISIFGILRRCGDAVAATHSCNVSKPWCMRCPKCLYVWLGYTAFLEPDIVAKTFGARNPLAEPENRRTFRELVGLADRQPFECIGGADEAALMLAICLQRGYTGENAVSCTEAVARLNISRTLDRYLSVDFRGGDIPNQITRPLKGVLDRNAAETRSFIEALLA